MNNEHYCESYKVVSEYATLVTCCSLNQCIGFHRARCHYHAFEGDFLQMFAIFNTTVVTVQASEVKMRVVLLGVLECICRRPSQGASAYM